MTVGSKIRSLRKKCGLTQSELANGIISRGMLSQIENGLAMPSLQTLSELANRLSVSPAFLLDESDTLPRADWRRISDRIANAFHAGDYSRCLRVLSEAELQKTDAATDLFLFCHIELAVQYIFAGEYTRATAELDLAEPLLHSLFLSERLISSEKFRFLRLLIEHTEHPEILMANAPDAPDFTFLPMHFFTAQKWLADKKRDAAEALLTCGALPPPYADFIRAKIAFGDRNYVDTLLTLKQLCQAKDCPLFLSLQATAALEECCRVCEDYKGAYENQLQYRELLTKFH